HGIQAYNSVMDRFATEGLRNNIRRDKNSRCLFHFRDGHELMTVRDAIYQSSAHAFYIPTNLQASHPGCQMFPIGEAWILNRTLLQNSDFYQDKRFFIDDS
ncbi:7601_t:CDS:1, partial [Funneliformis geosporum]